MQVTWLGYPNTTGLAAMDLRITDADADPPGETDLWHTERLIRLPTGFLCYQAPSRRPVGPLPMEAAGHVTFGCFNALAKVSATTLRLWAAILQALPDARLVVKNGNLGDRAVRMRWLDEAHAHGLPRERIDVAPWAKTVDDHLALYGGIDMALDTYPYHGTTTTCEALWMGVPTVTLAGRDHRARVGVSLLRRVGLDELIAGHPEEYVALAVALAGNRRRLAEMRRTLRARMQASPLCDAPGFARAMEAAIQAAWTAVVHDASRAGRECAQYSVE
jgi:predicted O-linked N-acetylglucosamine transferase (SPINDLY family)